MKFVLIILRTTRILKIILRSLIGMNLFLDATGELLARETLAVLEETQSVDTLTAIAADNTAVNSGCDNGLFTLLEQKLGRHLQFIGCMLHLAELPLRSIFYMIDGGTEGPTSFSGPVGQLCTNLDINRPQVAFEKIPFDLDVPDAIAVTLSWEQRIFLAYCTGVHSGEVQPRYARMRIGPLCHSRWLTLGTRILAAYVREDTPSHNLKILAQFVVKVYSKLWFGSKVSSQLKDVPAVVFNAVQGMKEFTGERYTFFLRRSLYQNIRKRRNGRQTLRPRPLLKRRRGKRYRDPVLPLLRTIFSTPS